MEKFTLDEEEDCFDDTSSDCSVVRTSSGCSSTGLSTKLVNVQRITQLGSRIGEFFDLITPGYSLAVSEEIITALSHVHIVEEDLLYELSLELEPVKLSDSSCDASSNHPKPRPSSSMSSEFTPNDLTSSLLSLPTMIRGKIHSDTTSVSSSSSREHSARRSHSQGRNDGSDVSSCSDVEALRSYPRASRSSLTGRVMAARKASAVVDKDKSQRKAILDG